MKSDLPSYDQAAAKVTAYAAQLGRFQPAREFVGLEQASGRVLAHPLLADSDQPPFARSTRDGYACRSVEASTHAPLTINGVIRAGDPPFGSLKPGTVWEIMTGAPIPAGADAVMMYEHAEMAGGAKPRKVRLLQHHTLKAGENIVAQGAQARTGDELLCAGVALHAAQIALAAAFGYSALNVFVRPRVAILTTGDELVSVSSSPALGKIRNSNAPMLAAMVAAAGGEPWVLPTAADDAQALDAALSQVDPADLLLTSGGVSAGKFDLVEAALTRRKAEVHFSGVRIQPGKPTVFGELPRSKGADSRALFFFGLPGNPIASAVSFLLFAAPLLASLAGSREVFPRFCLARLSLPLDRRGKAGITRFLPAFCDFGAIPGQPPQLVPVPSHGSGDLAALACSNCFIVAPEGTRTMEAGSLVRILLF